jgi:hypothetical protein
VEASQGYNDYEYYKLFQLDSYPEIVVEPSKLCSGQKDLLKASAQVNLDTYRQIIYFPVHFQSYYLLIISSLINCFPLMSSCFLYSIILFAIRCTVAVLLISDYKRILRGKML